MTATALELANRVYSYVVITIDTITDAFYTNTDLFTYNITSYYTSIKFMDVMIDTRASKCFIVGYSQFLVL
jgi:hypothetical protein